MLGVRALPSPPKKVITTYLHFPCFHCLDSCSLPSSFAHSSLAACLWRSSFLFSPFYSVSEDSRNNSDSHSLYTASAARASLVSTRSAFFASDCTYCLAFLLSCLSFLCYPLGGMANFPSALPVRTWSNGLLGASTGIALPLH